MARQRRPSRGIRPILYRIWPSILIICLLLRVGDGFSVRLSLNNVNIKKNTRSGTSLQASTSSNNKKSTLPPSIATTPSRNRRASQQKQRSLARGNNPLISLNLNLDSLAQQGAAQRAQELLERIEALHDEGYYAVAPDAVSYNSVLNAWARSSEQDSVERALELFETMKLEPNLVSFNTLLLALAKKGHAASAQDLLHHMTQQGPTPDTISYNSVLLAWALCGAAPQAEEVLREMIATAREETTHPDHLKADTISFNTVLDAWANHAGRHSQEDSLQAAVRGEELLRHMEQMYEAGNGDVEPDVYSYTSVIKAWAWSRHDEAGIRAKEWLDRMERPESTCAPNYVTYSCCMTAFAKCGQAEEAQALLGRLLHLYEASNFHVQYQPDTIAFSAVIDAWAQSEEPERAVALLQRMERLSQQSAVYQHVVPNEQTYTSVLSALAKRGWADRAHDLLEKLESHEYLEPSTIHYNAVLDAWAKSSDRDKAAKAQKLLVSMKGQPELQVDIISFNSVLSACANSFGPAKRKALLLALQTYKEIQQNEHLKPTSITYFLLLKAIRKLSGDRKERSKLIITVWQQCCDQGLVNERVLEQARLGCKDNVECWRDLFKDAQDIVNPTLQTTIPVRKLPRDWTSRSYRTR